MADELERKGRAKDLHLMFNALLMEYVEDKGEHKKIHEPLTITQVGELYAVTVLNDISQRLWLSKMQDIGDPQRDAKRSFQEATRVVIYKAVHRLNPDLNIVSRETRLDQYQERSRQLLTVEVKRSNTIEYALHVLLTRDQPFLRIGEAVIAGAKSYFEEKPEDFSGGKYKMFLEYQRIHKELERRLYNA
jgi:hypothetical protein